MFSKPSVDIPSFDLVLTEGIVGTGKSGLAQAVTLSLESASVQCRWFFEMEEPNPIGRSSDQSLPESGFARSIVQWQRFITDWDAAAPAVIDGRFLHLALVHALAANESDERIADWISKLYSSISLRDSLLVVLTNSDVRGHLEHTFAARKAMQSYSQWLESTAFGKTKSVTGIDLAVVFNESVQSHLLSAVAPFPSSAKVFDRRTTRWSDILESVCACIGVPSYRDNMNLSDLSEMVIGDYHLELQGTSYHIGIRHVSDSLVMTGHPWSSNQAAEMEWTLLPHHDEAFVVRSAPIRFVPEHADGRLKRIWQKGWFSDWGTLDVPLVKAR